MEDTAEQWLDLARTLTRREQYEEAVQACHQAILLNPNHAMAYENKGYALWRLKRYEEALQAYEQALRLDPENGLNYEIKSHLLNALGRYEESITACNQALSFGPNAIVWDNKGDALYKLKRYEEALEAYDEGIRLWPEDPIAYFTKGLTLRALGRRTQARQMLQKAREVGGQCRLSRQ